MSNLRQLTLKLVTFFDVLASVYLAPISVLASAIVIAVNYFTFRSYYVYATFFSVLVASVLYLAVRGKLTSPGVRPFAQLSSQTESRVHKVLSILFFCVVTVCILLLSATLYSRPPAFFILVSLLGGLIAIEIAISSDTRYSPSVLVKTIILGILIRASVYFEFPSTVGTDPWWHTGFIQYVLDSGYIPAHVLPYSTLEYPSMPMMHLFVAGLALTSGMGVHISYFFIGIVECLAAVFIFLIGKTVMSERSGLLAALLFVLASQLVLWGFYIGPMTFGVVLTLVALFVIILVPRSDFVSFTVLILVVFASVILTHEGTAAYTAIALIGVIITFAFIRTTAWASGSLDKLRNTSVFNEHFRSFTLLVVLFAGSLMSYWIFIGGATSERFFGILNSGVTPASSLTTSSSGSAAAYALTPSSLPLLNDSAVLILIIFATFGLLWILNKERKNALTMSWFGASALLLLITTVIYFAGGGGTLPERYIVYLQVFLVIPAAVGVLLLGTLPNPKKGIAVIFTAALIVGFVGINSTTAKIVNELPWENRPRIALEQSEISAAVAITNKTNGGPITTDSEYSQIFVHQLHARQVSTFDTLSDNSSLSANSSLLLRNDIVNSPFVTNRSISAPLGADRYATLKDSQNVLFDDGSVKVVAART